MKKIREYIRKNYGWMLVFMLVAVNFSIQYGPEIARSIINVDQDSNDDVDVAYGGTNVSALNAITAILTGSVGVTEDNDGDTYLETDPEVYGYLVTCNTAQTFTLPEIDSGNIGMNICFLAEGADGGTALLTIACNAADTIEVDGTGSGTSIDNTGSSEKGDFICFIAATVDHWITFGRNGIWN